MKLKEEHDGHIQDYDPEFDGQDWHDVYEQTLCQVDFESFLPKWKLSFFFFDQFLAREGNRRGGFPHRGNIVENIKNQLNLAILQ